MRLTNELRDSITRAAMTQLWPEGWADEMAKPIIEYLASDRCEATRRARAAVRDFPKYIDADGISCTFSDGTYMGECVHFDLPFRYPQKERGSYGCGGRSISYSINDDGSLRDYYGTDLPENLKESTMYIIRELQRKKRFKIEFRNLLSNIMTTEALLEKVPLAAAAVEEACGKPGEDTADEDIDDINRLIGGDV